MASDVLFVSAHICTPPAWAAILIGFTVDEWHKFLHFCKGGDGGGTVKRDVDDV